MRARILWSDRLFRPNHPEKPQANLSAGLRTRLSLGSVPQFSDQRKAIKETAGSIGFRLDWHDVISSRCRRVGSGWLTRIPTLGARELKEKLGG
jgi:hypothetical protein